MMYIKAKHYNTPLHVYCDGNYYFVDACVGLCAIARRSIDKDGDSHFDVELTVAIDEGTVKRIVNRNEGTMYIRNKTSYSFTYPEGREVSCALPYGLQIQLVP